MSDELELKTIQGVRNNNNVASDVTIEVAEVTREEHDGAVVKNESENIPQYWNELQRVKRELNEVVVWKLKVWMVIVIILCLIALVFAITAIVCTDFVALPSGIALSVKDASDATLESGPRAVAFTSIVVNERFVTTKGNMVRNKDLLIGHDDEDEKFDRSSFVVERFFRGNFTLANNSFTSHPVSQPDGPKKLQEHLKHQLTVVYNSSPALARYFSNITINSIRNSTAEFELQFNTPSENQQLVLFTLSKEMVKNVLLQYFYDQDPDSGDPFYVIPISLSMEVGPMRGT